MKDKISIVFKVLPQFGEILLAVGIVARREKQISENKVALERLKTFLIEETKNVKYANRLFFSEDFQKIIYDYTGMPAGIFTVHKPIDDEKIVNIYLFDFFSKSLWPIIVNRYFDNVCISEADAVKVSINIKKNVYATIYGENENDTFFKELKDFLYANYIIVSKAQMKSNGDMLVELLVPIVKN